MDGQVCWHLYNFGEVNYMYHFISVVQEAVSTGNSQLISATLQKRDLQRHTTRMIGVPALLQKLKEVHPIHIILLHSFFLAL